MLWTVCRWLAELARRTLEALYGRRGPAFSELAEEVLEQKKLCAPTTFALAKYVVPRLVAFFGAMAPAEISESHWRAYVVARQAKLPGCKLFDDKKYMTQVLRLAHRRGLVSQRIELKIPDVRNSSSGREILPGEIARLLRAAGGELRFMIQIALMMGLRRKELLSLRWPDFDWQRRMVRIVSTKTGRARDVPVVAELYEKFRRRMHPAMSDCVFPGRFDVNQPKLDHKTAWQATKRRARVKARWGDLRITCATVMLRRGASISATARILGNSEKIVREWYERLSAADLHRAAALTSGKKRTKSRAARRRRSAVA